MAQTIRVGGRSSGEIIDPVYSKVEMRETLAEGDKMVVRNVWTATDPKTGQRVSQIAYGRWKMPPRSAMVSTSKSLSRTPRLATCYASTTLGGEPARGLKTDSF